MSEQFTQRVTFLSELLKEINSQAIQVPKTDEGRTWSWEQQRNLLCSIYEGLPIGSITILNTQIFSMDCHDAIGRFKLMDRDVKYYSTYLVEGVRRMTSLYSMLTRPPTEPEVQEGENPIQVYCDLSSSSVDNLFMLKKDIQLVGNDVPDHYMPLNIVFDNRAFMIYERRISDQHLDWADKASSIMYSFKNCKMSIISLESNDQERISSYLERIQAF